MSKLNIFVSSTCYDLAQIRKDLNEAITALGHNPIMCENTSFPIDPSDSNFGNCLRIVEEEVDVFVLIIGNRYGSKNETTGKSITNSEFLKAVEKGIPIYTFTLQSMIYVYDVWKDNPDANFSSIVDNNQVFEFIKDVRYKSNKWNFSFNSAQDIITILKDQLSILFKISLSYQHKIDGNKYAYLRTMVSKEAFDLLVNRPDNYETKFLLKCMTEAIDSYKDLRNDFDYAIYSKSESRIESKEQYVAFSQVALGKMRKTIDSVNNLFSLAIPKFYAEPGVPSDISGLYYIAKTYGKLYASLLETSIECMSLVAEDSFIPVLQALSNLSRKAIEQMETFPNQALKKVQDTEQESRGKDSQIVDLTLTLSISDDACQCLSDEMEKLFLNK